MKPKSDQGRNEILRKQKKYIELIWGKKKLGLPLLCGNEEIWEVLISDWERKDEAIGG